MNIAEFLHVNQGTCILGILIGIMALHPGLIIVILFWSSSDTGNPRITVCPAVSIWPALFCSLNTHDHAVPNVSQSLKLLKTVNVLQKAYMLSKLFNIWHYMQGVSWVWIKLNHWCVDEMDRNAKCPVMLLCAHCTADICRVCRSEGTQDKPLYHPCVCTGSIKFIHQEWYVQWPKKEYGSILLILLLKCVPTWGKNSLGKLLNGRDHNKEITWQECTWI